MSKWDDSELVSGWDDSELEAAPTPQQVAQHDQALTRATGWQQDPSKPPSVLVQALGGAKHAWDKAAYGLANALAPNQTGNDNPLFPSSAQRKRELQEGSQFVKDTGPASSVGQFLGDVAIAAPIATALPASIIPQIAGNAAWAGLTAPENRAEAAALGGAGGGVGHVLGKTMSGLVSPTKDARTLMDAGVPLTAGQQAGGFLQKLERAGAKIPYTGSPLRARMDEATAGFQQATRDAVAPGMKTIDELYKHLDDAYSTALQSAKFPDKVKFTLNAEDLVKQGSEGKLQAPAASVKNAVDVVQDVLSNITEPNPYLFHEAEKRLKHIAFQYKSSLDPAQREYGLLIYDAAKALKSDWRSKLLGDTGKALQTVDAAYEKFIPIRSASSKGVGTLETPEDYTPRMLLQALRQGDRTPTKSTFLKGEMPQQPLAQAAERVIGSKSMEPDVASKILTGGGVPVAAIAGHGIPTAIASSLLYGYGTKAGQSFMTGNSVLNSKALAQALRRGVPTAAIAGSRQADDTK